MTTLVVIGGGPAGVAAALEGVKHAANVVLVANEPIGGRATWHSLVPSKVCLALGEHLEERHLFTTRGVSGPAPHLDLDALRARIADEAQAWSKCQAEALSKAGVRVLVGTASFASAGRLSVRTSGDESEDISFDRAIIASGSVPIFFPALKPDGVRILAPRAIGKLGAWPQAMIMIGGGITGAEYASFFRSVGAEVTWVTDREELLERSDPEAATALEASFAGRGIRMLKGAPVAAARVDAERVLVELKDGRTLEGSHAFIAIGRRPDLGELGLAAAGIAHTALDITIDAHCRTSVAGIYAVGDVTGPPFVANRGLAQARVAACHALGAATAPFRAETVIEATYTRPQLAEVGLSERTLQAQGRTYRLFRAEYAAALKPRLAGHAEGFLKITTDADDRRILGACAFGDHAADVLAPITVAIAGGLGVEELAALFAAHPTVSELPGIALRGY